MNRVVDDRADLYSFGVTLYEMLSGALPFADAKDALELVHCHLARSPKPPHEVDPTISPILSDIVLKLLAKHAENRYQSANGVKIDLEKALDSLKRSDASPTPFPLAQADVSSQFRLPQKLY